MLPHSPYASLVPHAIRRRTLRSAAHVRGMGLFSGTLSSLSIAPAPAGHGIRVARVDRPGSPSFPIHVSHLSKHRQHNAMPAALPPRNTAVALDPADPTSPGAATVEHVMSALAGLGITDALLQLDGPEIPIGDGSALFIAEAILVSGLVDMPETIEPITLDSALVVRDERSDASIRVVPRHDASCSFTYHAAFAPPVTLPPQACAYTAPLAADPELYAREIAPARTFSFEHEADAMRGLGLFASFTPRDLLVLRKDGSPIENTTRFENEPARHKLLDLVGDLYLLGRPLHADVVAVRSGHALTHEVCRRIFLGAQSKPRP